MSMDPLGNMFPSIFKYSNPNSFVNKLRKKRAVLFAALVERLQESPITILDVGGNYTYWQRAELLDPERFHITLLNLDKPEVPPMVKNVIGVAGDATKLNFSDKSFDIVFSNSVIEHMGSRQGQKQMAHEVQRAGKRHFIQTPNQRFPFEPHSRIPGFQFLPRPVRAALIYHLNINYFPKKSTFKECLAVSDSTMMLTHRQYRQLFPDSYIYGEKLFGMVKSHTAVGGWDKSTIEECVTVPQ